MNRKSFIKTLGVASASSFLLGCEKMISGKIILPQDVDEISILDAKDFFSKINIFPNMKGYALWVKKVNLKER